MTERSVGVVGIDIGGTRMKAVRMDGDCRVHAERQISTPATHAVTDVIAATVDLVSGFGTMPAAVGITVPGIVDEAAGRAEWSANLGWRDIPFRELLCCALRRPVALGHDVRAGCLAELRLGAARQQRHAVFLPIGTGIAAALVLDGQIYRGSGRSGEIGHVVVDPDGEICGCGRRGCLETIASAAAIARRYSARSGRQVGGAAEVAGAMEAGDAVAAAVWSEAVEALAGALALVTALLAPDMIVIGGGLAEAGSLLLAPLRRSLESRLIFERSPEIVGASMGARAGSIGAGLLALDLLGSDAGLTA